jgi:hypothetical protein
MDKHPAVLYKTLVVGVLLLFIFTNLPVTPSLSAPNNTSKCGWVPIDNQPPEPPEIDGPTNWPPGIEICFIFRSFDPNYDNVSYFVDWGDGTFEETYYIQHNTPVEICHTYEEKETYLLRARAIDIYGYKGDWSTFYIPINKDDCDICQKPSKRHIDILTNLIERLEKYDNQLSIIFKYNPELEEQYQELSDSLSLLKSLIGSDNFCNLLGIVLIITSSIVSISFSKELIIFEIILDVILAPICIFTFILWYRLCFEVYPWKG